MSVTLAVGTTVAIASAYGTQFTITSITNSANATTPCVATLSASHGVVVGDFIEVTSGWGLLSGRVVRASVVSVNDVTLEGVFTNDTVRYPAGSSAGTGRKISTWMALSQLTSDITIGGGDQQYANVTELADRTERQIPTVRSPLTVTLGGYFDQSLGWVATVRTASDSATATAVRLVYPNHSRTVGNAYWSLSDMPTINDKTLRSQISLSFSAQPINYAT